MKSPYDQRTDKTRDRIRGNRKSYYPNKHYQSAEGNFYYYINEASDTSTVKYRFELKIEEKCYLVEYV